MTWGEFAVIAVVLVSGSLGIAMLTQRRGDDRDHETARQLQGMYQLGRVVFSIAGIVAVVVGLVFDIPVVVLGGVASLLAGFGQHWALRTTRR
jgi:flagellar biosynthesis component FlhA